ncbi:MAG TPA: DUF3489 domain-containing protein [Stellaceae bacterium]|nr:DUF3489 domain-containing protein [Stellaceae bacterium]
MTKNQGTIDVLPRPVGATVPQVAADFGWQQHAVRGYLTNVLRQKVGLETDTMTKRHYGIC